MIAAIAGTFSKLVLLNVAARLFEYALVCLSAVILSFRAREVERMFRLPLGFAIPSLATLLCIALLTRETPPELLAAAAALAVGLILYALTQWTRLT